MDAETLAEVMGHRLPLNRYAELLPQFERAMRQARATTVNSAAMFIAQLAYESDGLKAQEEYADGSRYEGRTDIGNTQPGDGKNFKGRGWIQVTGRTNYRNCSAWAHKHGIVPTPDYFITHPKKLGEDQYAWVGPVWYWTQARPQLPVLAERGDLIGATRAINGGLNGLDGRRATYNRAKQLGDRILPTQPPDNLNIMLNYARDQVTQDTGWFCGPASCQTVIRAATGNLIPENTLAAELGTTRNGTDSITTFPDVLNKHVPGADFAVRTMPNDPPEDAEKAQLWEDVVGSLRAGFGVVANIVAPQRNYPQIVAPSTIPFQYHGGTVFHYIAVMGVRESADGFRAVWIADSGFSPYGGWIAFDQLATLIPPKGYAFAAARQPAPEPQAQPVPEYPPFPWPEAMFQQYVITQLDDLREQICGHGGRHPGSGCPGWPQLGFTPEGDPLSLVDGVSAVRLDIADLHALVEALKTQNT